MKNTRLIKRFVPYYKNYLGVLIFDLFCAMLTIVCEMVFPMIIGFITDTAMTDVSKLTVELIVTVGGIYLALRIVAVAANYFMQNVGHIMGAKIETDMRRDLFHHLQKLDFSYYASAKVGQIMSRITSDLFEVTEFSHHCPEEFFIAALKITVAFIILCTYNVWLTLIIFCVIPLMMIVSVFFNKKMRSVFKEQRSHIGEINAQVEDSLLGIRVVKSFTGEIMEEQKFKDGNDKFLSIKRRAYRYMAGFHSSTRIFDGLMYLTGIVGGSLFLIGGKITVGEFTAYLLFIGTLLNSIRQIVEFTEQFQRGMTGIERFYEIMDESVRITDKPNAIQLTNVKGEISFQNVSFNYSDDAANVLRDICLTVHPGEKVAIVGPSGSGKTTLCNLIPRFYETVAGEILLDSVNVNQYTLSSLRRAIGIVQQDVYLFAGTIKENIAYGRPDAADEQIIQAAIDAGADDFIRQLPNGYDTYVGERGVKLSGGQKQRVSIARVFLKNPPILILDEATSALDNESERLIQRSLSKLSAGRTTLTIAHRLTTIQNADRIVVLTKNGIEEIGTHQELLAKKGIYFQMNNLN